MSSERIESILAADCGAVFSKAILVESVDGEFRCVGLGEALTTPDDLSEGLAEAIRDIEAKTGRQLLEGRQLSMPRNPSGGGVDASTIACSAGRPINLIAVGISPGQSLLDAHEVAAGAPVNLVASVSIPDIRHPEKARQKIAELQRAQADAILFVASQESAGSRLLTEVCELIASAGLAGRRGDKLPLIFAGSHACFAPINEVLGPILEIREVEPARTLSSDLSLEPAASALNQLYLERSVLGLPGLGTLTGDKWSATIAAPIAIRAVAQFFSKQAAKDVMVIDLGANATTVATARSGRGSLRISTDCGLGPGVFGLLGATETEEVCRWLPFESEVEQVLEVGLNKGLRPHTVPQSAEELYVEEALARAAIRHTLRQSIPDADLLIASGGFLSRLPRHGRLVLLLLDAVQPRGMVSLALDEPGILPALGALAAAFPVAAAEVIMKDALRPLGTAVCLSGQEEEGQIAARVGIRYAGGSGFDIEVPFGGIEVIPLGDGQKAKLQVQPAPGFQLGNNPKGRPIEVQVNGGSVGIIIDARGKPLQIPVERHLRIRKLSNWYAALDT